VIDTFQVAEEQGSNCGCGSMETRGSFAGRVISGDRDLEEIPGVTPQGL